MTEYIQNSKFGYLHEWIIKGLIEIKVQLGATSKKILDKFDSKYLRC